ncbi:hypothetical protein PR048_032676 [Dryococelus australis]|uniref:Uncharacterized protein n=1 Tax=Dryococelus australis TaxID=614101 RepID=A0ABQ9G2V4_9NEOP|nr:hypothetical protein PR048_032676 [Dryococelus australis]
MPLVGGFSRGSPVSPRPCLTALLHIHLTSPSSVPKTSMFTAAKTSLCFQKCSRYLQQPIQTGKVSEYPHLHALRLQGCSSRRLLETCLDTGNGLTSQRDNHGILNTFEKREHKAEKGSLSTYLKNRLHKAVKVNKQRLAPLERYALSHTRYAAKSIRYTLCWKVGFGIPPGFPVKMRSVFSFPFIRKIGVATPTFLMKGLDVTLHIFTRVRSPFDKTLFIVRSAPPSVGSAVVTHWTRIREDAGSILSPQPPGVSSGGCCLLLHHRMWLFYPRVNLHLQWEHVGVLVVRTTASEHPALSSLGRAFTWVISPLQELEFRPAALHDTSGGVDVARFARRASKREKQAGREGGTRWGRRRPYDWRALTTTDARDRLTVSRQLRPSGPRERTMAAPASSSCRGVLRARAAAAERSDCSPPTRGEPCFQSPAGTPLDSRMWESCWTMPLVGGFSRGSPLPPPAL